MAQCNPGSWVDPDARRIGTAMSQRLGHARYERTETLRLLRCGGIKEAGDAAHVVKKLTLMSSHYEDEAPPRFEVTESITSFHSPITVSGEYRLTDSWALVPSFSLF